MDVLKKIKASSLNEVLVATIIIVIIFSLAITILSNITKSVVQKNTKSIENKLNELVYLYRNKKIMLPYKNEDELWNVNIIKSTESNFNIIEFQISSKKTRKTLSRKLTYRNEES